MLYRLYHRTLFCLADAYCLLRCFTYLVYCVSWRKKLFSVIIKFSLKTCFIFMCWIYTVAIKRKTVPYSGHHFHHCGWLFTNSCRVTGAVSSSDRNWTDKWTVADTKKRVAARKGHCNAILLPLQFIYVVQTSVFCNMLVATIWIQFSILSLILV